MNRTAKTTKRGFSVVEVLVALAIFAVIFVAALAVYDRSNKVFKAGVESSEMQQNIRVAFDKLVGDIRMTGFDFDRDGIPSGSTTVSGVTYNFQQQADEQFEQIGATTLTIRANFDYETETDPTVTNDGQNGRESDYESPPFPIVTTGNDEIVSYVLKSADTTKNTNSITYYADTYKPRKVYVGTGGLTERTVTISGIDTTNANPPYTLYRVTLSNDNNATPVFTQIANNIRSMNFTYYEDTTGVKQLTDLSGATVNPDTYASGETGLDPNNPTVATAFTPRAIRRKIQSVRMTLIGMNESPTPDYTNPTETIAAAKPYRQYRLESLIVPRNFNKHGMIEQESKPPGIPTLDGVCIGWCGLAYLQWEAPPVNATQGAVDTYKLLYGTTDPPTIPVNSTQLSADIISNLDPNQSYYFAIQAVNSYGAGDPSPTLNAVAYSVANATTPSVPTALVASGGGGSSPAAMPNQIVLSWQRPTTNIAGTSTCYNAPGKTITPPPWTNNVAEIKGWRIDRRDSSGTWSHVVTETTASNVPELDPITGTVTWKDKSVANCANYDYRVAEVEGGTPPCTTSGNTGGAQGVSGMSNIAPGQAQSDVTPTAPEDLAIDATTSDAQSLADPTNYHVYMSWPRVQTDINSALITVGNSYVIHILRRAQGDTNPPVEIGTALYTGTGAATEGPYISIVPKTDAAGTVSYQYAYFVTAKQCSSPESGPSPTRYYPCVIPGATINVVLSIAVEGDGSASNPWLTTTPSTLEVTTGGVTADSIEVDLMPAGGGSRISVGTQTNTSDATFSLPNGLTNGVIYELIVTVQKGTCTLQRTYYFEETANNCCLVPFKDQSGNVIDASVMTLDGPSGVVHVLFKNSCDEDLTILTNGIRINWDETKLNSNPHKLSEVRYPASRATSGTPTTTHVQSLNASGTPVTTSPDLASSPGYLIIPAGGVYAIDIKFSRSFSQSPVTKVCVTYTQATGNDTCQIIPGPSQVDGVCDAP